MAGWQRSGARALIIMHFESGIPTYVCSFFSSDGLYDLVVLLVRNPHEEVKRRC